MMWPALGGVLLVAVIAAVVVVVVKRGSGSSVNQAQECSRAVYPYIKHSTIQGPGGDPGALPTTTTGIFGWEAGRIRQAAQKASSDAPLAKDLNTIVTGLLMMDQADGSPGKYTSGLGDMTRGMKAVGKLCPLAGGSSDTSFTPAPAGSQPSASQPPAAASPPRPAGSSTASQKAMCAAVRGILTPTTGSSLAANLRLMEQKYRQAAQRASSDRQLASELNAAAADVQKISTTLASGGNPSNEDTQLARDEGTLNSTLNTLCGPASG